MGDKNKSLKRAGKTIKKKKQSNFVKIKPYIRFSLIIAHNQIV